MFIQDTKTTPTINFLKIFLLHDIILFLFLYIDIIIVYPQ